MDNSSIVSCKICNKEAQGKDEHVAEWFCSSKCQRQFYAEKTQQKGPSEESLSSFPKNDELISTDIGVKIDDPLAMPALDEKFYEIFNGPRDWYKSWRTEPNMYGDVKVIQKGSRWKSSFVNFGIGITALNEQSIPSSSFYLTYDVWEPAGWDPIQKHRAPHMPPYIATLILTHGVPVNRREWYPVVRYLAQFMRVITVDLLGMGDSSKPRDFDYWSWKLHADIFKGFIEQLQKDYKDWFPLGKLFLGANDWGAGMVQKFVELYQDKLFGAIICSAVALDGYWVQHIGSLNALATMPYDVYKKEKSVFMLETIRFVGFLTSLLETMFHRTADIHNQYTMAMFQEPYVEISYSNPKKNPKNTRYKPHAVRVLAQQAAAALGNGELLPYHPKENPNGLNFSVWNVPLLFLWGKNDKMMPEGQVYRFEQMVVHINHQRHQQARRTKLKINTEILDDAGHFAVTDQPEKAASAIMKFIQQIVDPRLLATSFLGFDSIARGDEKRASLSLDAIKKQNFTVVKQ